MTEKVADAIVPVSKPRRPVGDDVPAPHRHTASRPRPTPPPGRQDRRAGGYDPSLAPEAYTDAGHGAVDFIVRADA
jgi:hypothetical protein